MSEQVREKELRYISLLEQRIASLESLLSKNDDEDGRVIPGPTSPGCENGLVKGLPLTVADDETIETEGIKDAAANQGRVRYMTRKWEDGVRVPALDEKKQERPTQDVQFDRAFTFYTDIDDDKKFTGSNIEVEGEELKSLLRSVLKQYPGIIFEGSVISLGGPFEALVHHWDDLLVAEPDDPQSESGKRAKEDLALLLDSVRKSRELEDFFKIREAHRSAKVTSYDWQWTLFAPGSLVYAEPCLSQPQLLIVDSLGPAPRRIRDGREEPPDKAWSVICSSLDWNGTHFVKTPYVFRTERYRGTRSVAELSCYPVEYYIDKEYPERKMTYMRDQSTHENLKFKHKSYGDIPVHLWELLVNRGKRFHEYSTRGEGRSRMFRYDGQVLFWRFGVATQKIPQDDLDERSLPGYPVRNQPAAAKPPKTMSVHHNIIIDPESYVRYEDSDRPLGALRPYRGPVRVDWASSGYGLTRPIFTTPLDHHFLCTPPRLLGFVPQKKIWAQFLVDNLSEAEIKGEDSFKENLELDENYADTIWALVKNHESAQQQARADSVGRKKKEPTHTKLKDSVDGKGNGLVLLFHGPPGVGKTLTAELVAEASGKPLFSISVAEIGVVANDVERNLDQHFALAGRWEAVLLIDEADVFLESRTSISDHERNALVSVMLRVLEYYDGILILTTNRLSSIDIAVLSRLNLAVGYTQLGQAASESIWMKFLARINFDNERELEKVKRLVKKDAKKNKLSLNGRQIRNIISSAQAIAKQAKRELRFQDIEQMYDLVEEFQSGLADHLNFVLGQRAGEKNGMGM